MYWLLFSLLLMQLLNHSSELISALRLKKRLNHRRRSSERSESSKRCSWLFKTCFFYNNRSNSCNLRNFECILFNIQQSNVTYIIFNNKDKCDVNISIDICSEIAIFYHENMDLEVIKLSYAKKQSAFALSEANSY